MASVPGLDDPAPELVFNFMQNFSSAFWCPDSSRASARSPRPIQVGDSCVSACIDLHQCHIVRRSRATALQPVNRAGHDDASTPDRLGEALRTFARSVETNASMSWPARPALLYERHRYDAIAPGEQGQ
jgi:hypothetical protein